MNNKRQLDVRNGDNFSGEFIVQNPNQNISQVNRSYLVFDIKPRNLPIKVIAWGDSCMGYQKVFHGQKVRIEGQWHKFNGSLQIKCSNILDLNDEVKKISNANARIRTLIDWLPNDTLKQFIVRVFQDPQIIEDFITVPASLNHHHSYIGGLLVHSVDVAWQIFSNSQINPETKHLGIVVGLLHDIGKIRTLSSSMKRTKLGEFVDHEKLSLEILANHLSWLDKVDNELAISIRYLLIWEKKNYDPIPKLDAFELIKTADRISAGSSALSH